MMFVVDSRVPFLNHLNRHRFLYNLCLESFFQVANLGFVILCRCFVKLYVVCRNYSLRESSFLLFLYVELLCFYLYVSWTHALELEVHGRVHLYEVVLTLSVFPPDTWRSCGQCFALACIFNRSAPLTLFFACGCSFASHYLLLLSGTLWDVYFCLRRILLIRWFLILPSDSWSPWVTLAPSSIRLAPQLLRDVWCFLANSYASPPSVC